MTKTTHPEKNAAVITEVPSPPPDLRLERIHLRVRNIESVVGFYETFLGLRAINSSGNTVALHSAPGGQPLLLLTEDAQADGRNPSAPGLFHNAFLFPSRPGLAAAVRRILLNRWPIEGFADHGVSEAIYLSDPEGNGVELYVDKPQSQWPYQDGRLRMVTKPLDLKGLLATEGAATMAPASQTAAISVGHIHLQVSDLRKAEQFYHDLLGLDITQKDFPGALFFSAGGYHHHVGANIWNSRGVAPSPRNSAGLIGFTMRFSEQQAVEAVATKALELSLNVDVSTRRPLLRDHDGITIELSSQ